MKKLINILAIGLIFSLASSWLTLTVTGQTVEEKAFNRTVRVESGTGGCSGVILQTNLVLTAAHCILDEKDISIDSKDADLVKLDKEADLALLIGETIVMERIIVADLKVGDDVFTWGYPYSSPNRVLSRGHVAVIQMGSSFSTNFAFPGQSGSGLFDRFGRLVGVLTQSMERTGLSVNRTPDQIRAIWRF